MATIYRAELVALQECIRTCQMGVTTANHSDIPRCREICQKITLAYEQIKPSIPPDVEHSECVAECVDWIGKFFDGVKSCRGYPAPLWYRTMRADEAITVELDHQYHLQLKMDSLLFFLRWEQHPTIFGRLMDHTLDLIIPYAPIPA